MNTHIAESKIEQQLQSDPRRRTQEQIKLEADLTTASRKHSINIEIHDVAYNAKANGYTQKGFTNSFDKFMPFVLNKTSDLTKLMINDRYLLQILDLHDIYLEILREYFKSSYRTDILDLMAREIKNTIAILYDAIMKNKGTQLSKGFHEVAVAEFRQIINKLEC